jgi:predicted phage baseplate assembly protein
MGRPPFPRRKTSTTGAPLAGRAVVDYLPSEFADFVRLQRDLASENLGLPSESTAPGETPVSSEGDFAGTLMELSALIGHVLGVYQDRFANEAFLGTAQSPRSLVKHGRRLGYESSPGLSATGHLVLKARGGLRGTLPAGFCVSSGPAGEKKAQDFETVDAVDVDAAFNELWPRDRLEPVDLGGTALTLQGTGHGIAAGDVVVLRWGPGDFLGGQIHLAARKVLRAPEELADGTTRLELDPLDPALAAALNESNVLLYARPSERRHLFGWDTPPHLYGDADFKAGAFPAACGQPPCAGYISPASPSDESLFLDAEVKAPIAGAPVARVDESGVYAYWGESSGSAPVELKKVSDASYVVIIDGQSQIVPLTTATSVARTVTAMRVLDAQGQAVPRNLASLPIRASLWLFGWAEPIPVVTLQPSRAPVGSSAVLSGELHGLHPARLVALSMVEGVSPTAAEIVRLTEVSVGDGATAVAWEPVDPTAPSAAWTLGNLRLLGNVARISHGKTFTDLLGESDGVTPFLRFELKKAPLSWLPTAEGGEPALEVRVAGVAWTRALDFESSRPEDRHYLLQRDEQGRTFVLFGDGAKGAIPAAGSRSISAAWRVGLGVIGNSSAREVMRIQKASPLIEAAFNPLPVTGGAEPARAGDVRRRATGLVRTFERAVSVEDLADLALLFPGVARARARWARLSPSQEVLRLTVATNQGDSPPLAELRRFLDARRDDTVPLELVTPVPVPLVLEVGAAYDPAWRPELVELALRDAFCRLGSEAPGLFTFAGRDLGEPAFLSQIYERIRRVAGVAYAEVQRFQTAAGAPQVADTIVAEPDEWLSLSSNDLVVSMPAPEAK